VASTQHHSNKAGEVAERVYKVILYIYFTKYNNQIQALHC